MILKLLSLFLTSAFCLAESFHYPELMVTPTASERHRIEANKGTDYMHLLPIQLSSLMTLYTAMEIGGAPLTELEGDEKKSAESKQSFYSMLGLGVGLGWVGLTAYATVSYTPYLDGYRASKKMKGKRKKDQLLKERLAEENLRSLARIGRYSRYISTTTNFLANALMAGVPVETTESNALTYAGVGMLSSFLPLFFKTRYEQVFEDQERYKKRIYGPITMNPWLVPARSMGVDANSNLLGFRLATSF